MRLGQAGFRSRFYGMGPTMIATGGGFAIRLRYLPRSSRGGGRGEELEEDGANQRSSEMPASRTVGSLHGNREKPRRRRSAVAHRDAHQESPDVPRRWIDRQLIAAEGKT